MLFAIIIVVLFIVLIFAAGEIEVRPHRTEEDEIRQSGQDGEDFTAEILAKLSKNYNIFRNVSVCYDGETSELDIVVVGNAGVFIVENKNHRGIITGDFDDRYWRQDKVGRGGNAYSKDFYSPVKQVGTHVYRLANYLRDNYVNVHIDGIVFFSNPEAKVMVHGNQKDIPVFSERDNGEAGLLSYIKNGHGGLHKNTIDQICRLLEQTAS